MDKSTERIIEKVAIGLGVYLLIAKPVLDKLGLSDVEKQKLDSLWDGDNKKLNPFAVNNNYYVSYLKGKYGSSDTAATNADEQYWLGVYHDYLNGVNTNTGLLGQDIGIGDMTGLGSSMDVVIGGVALYKVYDLWSFFDHEENVMVVMRKCPDKTTVAKIAAAFIYIFRDDTDMDLYTYLQKGGSRLPLLTIFGANGGLSDRQLLEMMEYVMALPDDNFNS